MRLYWHVTGVAIFFLCFLFYLSKVLSTVLDDTTKFLLSKEELDVSPLNGTQRNNSDVQSIPRIIHQVYLGWGGLPLREDWIEAQQTCLDLHPDYEYMLWNNDTARNLLTTDFPWFLNRWDSYQYPIQRADSIRYFILVKYGGIYIDLDNGCKRRLDPLLAFPAWMPGTTNHLGLTNHIMATVQEHPYFDLLVHSLEAYDQDWYLPYLTIMNSAGPHFVSMVWDEYLKTGVPRDAVRVLDREEYEGQPWSFFTKIDGGTWHHWSPDEEAFKWMGQHVILVVGLALSGLGAAASISWCTGFSLALLISNSFRGGTKDQSVSESKSD